MCLSLEPGVKPQDALKTAEEDIVCYKVLKGYDMMIEGKEVFLSLYLNFEYVMGKKYQCKPELGLGFIRCSGYSEYNTLDKYEVHEAFHSYKYKESALNVLESFCKHLYKTVAVSKIVAVRCTIPKGSKYVENDAYYASDAIILDGIIRGYKNKLKIN